MFEIAARSILGAEIFDLAAALISRASCESRERCFVSVPCSEPVAGEASLTIGRRSGRIGVRSELLSAGLLTTAWYASSPRRAATTNEELMWPDACRAALLGRCVGRKGSCCCWAGGGALSGGRGGDGECGER